MSLVPLVYAAPNMISNTTSEDSFEKKHCENIYIHSKHLHTRHVRQAMLVCFRDQTRLFDLLLLSQTDQHEGLSPLRHRALHNLSTLPVEITP